MTLPASSVIIAPIGEPALSALKHTVVEAQSDDPFARVVVVTDHRDVASAARHLLGALDVINITAQTGERLAAELARPMLRPLGEAARSPRRPLARVHESQAVRQVADAWLASGHALRLSPAGRHRLYGELAQAFRQWEQRAYQNDEPDGVPESAPTLDLPALHDEFRALLDRENYYTRYELPRLAAQSLLAHWPEAAEPFAIYYLPRRPSSAELELMQTLLQRGRCRVIIGLTGDPYADGPALALYETLSGADAPADNPNPLEQAVDADTMLVTVAPDPVEEARAVVRRIAAIADDVPFHRIAVVHRQEAPYASLVRQELSLADIPCSGVPRRTLADTVAGRFLLDSLALAASMDGDPNSAPSIDREQCINLLLSSPVRLFTGSTGSHAYTEVPATYWSNLAREARANGTVEQWSQRLHALVEQQALRERERSGDDGGPGDPATGADRAGDGSLDIDVFVAFLDHLASRLQQLHRPSEPRWETAKEQLQKLLADYHLRSNEEADDYSRVERMLDGLDGLADWDAEYRMVDLRDAVADGLQSPVSDLGHPVGSGVYVGPPSGIVGADYDTVFVVGMTEGQFPPPHWTSVVSAWLDQGSAAEIQGALERYEFLGAVAAADRVVLSYPVAGPDRRTTYPSRWLLEAANLLHRRAIGATGAITAANVTTNADLEPWRTVIPSREQGLRQLVNAISGTSDHVVAPAHRQDYDLTHLLSHDGRELAAHPAWASNPDVLRALAANEARQGTALTPWDGLVHTDSRRVASIGSAERPVSPSALETWATCPYRYFLNRVLGLSVPPSGDEEDTISAMDRGSLVHRILKEFVNRGMRAEDQLLDLAEAEFTDAERRGITGYPLLWEVEKEAIRAGLTTFLDADQRWLGGNPGVSSAEVPFKDIFVEVEGVGPIYFHGRIDRVDVLSDEVRVRDFKAGGSTNNYENGSYAPPDPSELAAQLPGVVQQTLAELQSLSTECKDQSDRWYTDHLSVAIASLGNLGNVANDPQTLLAAVSADPILGNKGRGGSSKNWKRSIGQIKDDFEIATKQLGRRINEVIDAARQANSSIGGYAITNGRALQLPIYWAAARQMFSNQSVSASYCFPLADDGPAHDIAPYTGDDGQDEVFRQSLTHIVTTARKGIFPATPDDDAYGNCRHCDFSRLCPTRRRQVWERKGRHDPRVQPYNALRSKAAITADAN